MRTRIELGTSGSIDLQDDVPYSLNFAIADIRTPDKRDASYSKTIKIPGSKQNNRLFAHIFEVDIDCNFNPNIKTPCILYIDEIQQLKGYLQLLKVYTDDELKIQYEVTIKGAIGNIFTAIGDDELTDLDFSEWNHGYNKTNQLASWTGTIGEGYVYPMIDYGQTNGLTYDVNNFYPAIYVKEYIDKIFAYAGYTYSSTFFNSETFKRLIIPYNGTNLKLTEVEATSRVFYVGQTVNQNISIPPSGQTVGNATKVIFDDESTIDGFYDYGNQYNPATGIFTCANTGVYSFVFTFGDLTVNTGIAQGVAELFRYSGGVYTTYGTRNLGSISTVPTSPTSIINNSVPLLQGDQVFVGIQIGGVFGSPNTLTMIGSQLYNGVINQGIQDGGQVSLNDAVPPKIKQKDFFKSIINMFNLYIETDKQIDTKLNIEPRNDFYSSGTTIDWTDKLDVATLIQEPMGALDAKKYIFSYTEDKDYYNQLYKSSYNELYGTQNFDVTNDFLTQTKDNKIIFAPTPLYDGSWTDRIISAQIPPEFTVTALKGSVIRILYYGGVKNTVNPWNYTSYVSGTSIESTYPYAGHLDDPASPTLDLSFGVPKEVYYVTTVYTNNNLFNKYHIQFIEEITNKDSKIVTGYFYLTPKDILLLDFRNQFFVDGHLLRLNKIYDYNPVSSELTKCEFIKVKQAAQFVPTVLNSYGGNDNQFPQR